MNNSQLFQGIEFLKNLSLVEFFLFLFTWPQLSLDANCVRLLL